MVNKENVVHHSEVQWNHRKKRIPRHTVTWIKMEVNMSNEISQA